MKTYILEGLVIAKTQIAHNGGESSGNLVSFRRQKVVQTDGKTVDVPVISGNGIRGVLRDLGAAQLLTQLGNEEGPQKVDLKLFQMLFSGGSLTKTNIPNDVAMINKLRKDVPFLSLFGTANGNMMIPGKLKINPLLPICLETLHLVPEKFHPEKPVTCHKFMQVTTQTRKEDTENPKLEKFIDKVEGEIVPTTQMIYSMETIAAGTPFYWKVVLEDVTMLEFDAFVTLMETYKTNPIVGGKSAVGFGSIDIQANTWTEVRGNTEQVIQVTQDSESLYSRMLRENKATISETMTAFGKW